MLSTAILPAESDSWAPKLVLPATRKSTRITCELPTGKRVLSPVNVPSFAICLPRGSLFASKIPTIVSGYFVRMANTT